MGYSAFQENLVFLKLGGSLITEKQRPYTAHPEVLHRLGSEIAAALRAFPSQHLLLGHGSGSFGHVPAEQFGTRQAVRGEVGWGGFIEVWRAAAALNRLVLDAMTGAGIPVISFPPSAALIANDHRVESWNLEPIQSAIKAGFVPLVYGDVVFDLVRAGTIFSTEELFAHLAADLRPKRILLAGIEPGVWSDYPQATTLYKELRPGMLPEVLPGLAGSSAADVTGGMASKVLQSLDLVRENPGLEIMIFSGLQPGFVERALLGERIGTVLREEK